MTGLQRKSRKLALSLVATLGLLFCFQLKHINKKLDLLRLNFQQQNKCIYDE